MEPKPSIFDRISTVAERPDNLKCLIYGLPGVGKSVFAAKFPNPLILDSEHGTRSLVNHPELAEVRVLPINSFSDVEQVFWELRKGDSDIAKWTKTVVIDSISELQKRQLDEMLTQAAKTDSRRNVNLPYQQDYLVNTNALRRMTFAFRDLDINFVITAHSIEEKDDSTGVLFIRPDVTPKLARTLEGVMDVMGFLSIDYSQDGKAVRKLQVHPERRVKAKTRVGGLPASIINPEPSMLLEANRTNGQSAEKTATGEFNTDEEK